MFWIYFIHHQITGVDSLDYRYMVDIIYSEVEYFNMGINIWAYDYDPNIRKTCVKRMSKIER